MALFFLRTNEWSRCFCLNCWGLRKICECCRETTRATAESHMHSTDECMHSHRYELRSFYRWVKVNSLLEAWSTLFMSPCDVKSRGPGDSNTQPTGVLLLFPLLFLRLFSPLAMRAAEASLRRKVRQQLTKKKQHKQKEEHPGWWPTLPGSSLGA